MDGTLNTPIARTISRRHVEGCDIRRGNLAATPPVLHTGTILLQLRDSDENTIEMKYVPMRSATIQALFRPINPITLREAIESDLAAAGYSLAA